MRQLILDFLPEASPRLDNFVVGENAETMAALGAWLLPDNNEPSFFIWGEEACGKSHLLAASGAVYIDARADLSTLQSLSSAENSADLFAIDNVDFLDNVGQIALFNLFNQLRERGGKLLTAAKLPPQQLSLREDLRTRLGSGAIYRLNPLPDHEKKAALMTEAARRQMPLSGEMVDYLMSRVPRDMGSLNAFLCAIDRYSIEQKRLITLPFLREILVTQK